MDFDINAEVQSALPALLASAREKLGQRITQEVESVAMGEVRKAVIEWATANLVPEIKAQLEAGKEGMLKQAQTIAVQLGDALAAALTDQATKTMKSSSVVTDIAQKLFRGY